MGRFEVAILVAVVAGAFVALEAPPASATVLDMGGQSRAEQMMMRTKRRQAERRAEREYAEAEARAQAAQEAADRQAEAEAQAEAQVRDQAPAVASPRAPIPVSQPDPAPRPNA